jgi:hypothetical protein
VGERQALSCVESLVSIKGKEFYSFRFLKVLMISVDFAAGHGRLNVVTISVTEWCKWLGLFYFLYQIHFECQFLLCYDYVFCHDYA